MRFVTTMSFHGREFTINLQILVVQMYNLIYFLHLFLEQSTLVKNTTYCTDFKEIISIKINRPF